MALIHVNTSSQFLINLRQFKHAEVFCPGKRKNRAATWPIYPFEMYVIPTTSLELTITLSRRDKPQHSHRCLVNHLQSNSTSIYRLFFIILEFYKR